MHSIFPRIQTLLKTSASKRGYEGLNGMGSLSSALSSARKAIRKCYSSDHLRDVYGFDLVNGELKTRPRREFLEYRKAMLNFLLSAWG